MKTKRSSQSCQDSCRVSMNQPCSKACCCWCRETCVRYHHISAPAHPERGNSSSEPRVDTVRCRYASWFIWTFFFRLPFLEVPSFSFELPITKSIVVVPQKVTEGAIIARFFSTDTTSIRAGFDLLYTAHPNAGHDSVLLHH